MRCASLFLLATLLGGLLACGNGAPGVQTPAPPGSPLPIAAAPVVLLPDGSHLTVRIADQPQEQARGLMFVENLPDDEGMLFLFGSESARSFWMKNCKMTIDMIWLDGTFRIVDITHSAQPCQADPCPEFSPKVTATNVLEVRGGLSRDRGLKEGDTLVVIGAAGPASSTEVAK
jgi:hypothetical protein